MMKAKVIGCEKTCIMFKGIKPTECNLPNKYKEACEGRQQFKAGLKEAIDWITTYQEIDRHTAMLVGYTVLPRNLETKKKEWGIE